MRIAICDDNGADTKVLSTYIDDYCTKKAYDVEIVEFKSGDELLSEFDKERFDIVFLDIYMPGISGMETAQQLRAVDRDCIIIFITISNNHTMDGFMVRASGYLVKPFDPELLEDVLHLCKEKFERHGQVIEVPYRRDMISISVNTIHYVEVYGRKTLFHTDNGLLEIRLPLEKVELLLKKNSFLRCHRSYLINLNHIIDISTTSIRMKCGESVPIRKNGRKEVKTAIANFIAGTPSEKP